MRPGDYLPPRWPEARTPAQIERDAMVADLARALTKLHAAQLLALLQLWVSELPPQMVCDRNGQLLGLGYGDELVLPVSRLRCC